MENRGELLAGHLGVSAAPWICGIGLSPVLVPATVGVRQQVEEWGESQPQPGGEGLRPELCLPWGAGSAATGHWGARGTPSCWGRAGAPLWPMSQPCAPSCQNPAASGHVSSTAWSWQSRSFSRSSRDSELSAPSRDLPAAERTSNASAACDPPQRPQKGLSLKTNNSATVTHLPQALHLHADEPLLGPRQVLLLLKTDTSILFLLSPSTGACACLCGNVSFARSAGARWSCCSSGALSLL